MILLYGQLDDPPLQRTLEALQEAGAPYALLAQDTLDSEALNLETGPLGITGTVTVAGQAIPLADIRSVYARPLELPRRAHTPEGRGMRELHEHLFEWLDVADALVVSRPRAMHSNASKPLQAQLIAESGFAVPETLVTSDPSEARAFRQQHGRVIFKSISGVRSIVRELDDATAERLGLLGALPVQFQAYVPGVDVRVHVVGDETHAARIESPVVDYRYAARSNAEARLTATDIPRDVASRCIELARRMELPLAGIDLRERPDGGFVCFEVNPMPAYTYFEAHTGLPISRSLATLLLTADRN